MPVRSEPEAEIEEIAHLPEEEPIDEVADASRGDEREGGVLRCATAGAGAAARSRAAIGIGAGSAAQEYPGEEGEGDERKHEEQEGPEDGRKA